jgi:peptide-methionine (R)-S-oxide reductase
MDEGDFKKKLNPEQYRVLRQKGTEVPFTGKYWDHDEPGIYRCAACANELFSSRDKFNSGIGWPTFHKPIDEKNIQFKRTPDPEGIEMRCAKCKSHVGYLIAGDKNYYRANSASLNFEAREGIAFEDVVDTAQDASDQIDQQNQNNDSSTTSNASHLTALGISFGSIATFLGGGVVGAIAGGIGAFLVCQSMCHISLPASMQATSTAPTASTSQPIITPMPTSTRPASSSVSSSGRPVISTTTAGIPAAASSGTPAPSTQSSSAAGTP